MGYADDTNKELYVARFCEFLPLLELASGISRSEVQERLCLHGELDKIGVMYIKVSFKTALRCVNFYKENPYSRIVLNILMSGETTAKEEIKKIENLKALLTMFE